MPFFLVRVAVSLLRKLMLPLSLFVALGPNPEPSAGDLEAQAGTVNLPGALQQMVGTWKIEWLGGQTYIVTVSADTTFR